MEEGEKEEKGVIVSFFPFFFVCPKKIEMKVGCKKKKKRN